MFVNFVPDVAQSANEIKANLHVQRGGETLPGLGLNAFIFSCFASITLLSYPRFRFCFAAFCFRFAIMQRCSWHKAIRPDGKDYWHALKTNNLYNMGHDFIQNTAPQVSSSCSIPLLSHPSSFPFRSVPLLPHLVSLGLLHFALVSLGSAFV
jgi:hypothetical protein